jgi:hypothetical protein
MSRHRSDVRRQWFAAVSAGVGVLLVAAYLAATVSWMKFNAYEHPTTTLMFVLSPSISFVVLGLAALWCERDRYCVSLLSLCFGGAVGIVVNAFTMWMEYIAFLTPYEGGGVNMGLAALALGTPIFAPLLIFATTLAIELTIRRVGPAGMAAWGWRLPW